jgi:hypothetical protein
MQRKCLKTEVKRLNYLERQPTLGTIERFKVHLPSQPEAPLLYTGASSNHLAGCLALCHPCLHTITRFDRQKRTRRSS